jgi:RNA polymerase sigma-70 factor (ECF subfamily)
MRGLRFSLWWRGSKGTYQAPLSQPLVPPAIDLEALGEPPPGLLERLEAAMAVLPAVDREVFLAARIDNMSYVEIARRTGRSVKDIEKRMSRSIGVITRILEEGGGP